jgi:ElaB/YqjD/DUF883 family membrane-anchored ribosome-binding protein
MTALPRTTDDSRDALRARIEAAERRNAERSIADQAREVANAAADYTRANPLTVIGGALAVGLLIGLLTRPGRRVAGRAINTAGEAISGVAANASSGVKNVAARGGSRIGTMLGEAAVAYVMSLIDEVVEAARTVQDRAEGFGDAAGTQARRLSEGASDAASSAADSTRALARKAVSSASDLARGTKG